MTAQLNIAGPLAFVGSFLLLFPVSGCQDDPKQPQATPKKPPQSSAPPLQRARCPADAAPGCRSATGRVTYVEAVDDDGDGDAHLVLVSSPGVTAPGISVIDVRRDLRPRPLPGIGDRVSAAGPVYRGSYGQRQIEAVVVHVAKAGG